ncbi:MAG: alanine racemase [Planctomycetes bacterium]|nr:alanine racemase [Planctomycetota bacterium]
MNAYRAWAEIDLDALTHNLAVIRERAGAGTRVLLVVKADAYGHGAVPIAHHAVRSGVAGFGVGSSAEALELRRSGIRLPILVLGTIIDDEADDCLRHDVHVALHSSSRGAMLQQLARRMGLVAKVHVNVDTGMGRLGVLPGKAVELLREVRAAPNLALCGVMTHVSAPEGALAASTADQQRLFEGVLREARAAGLLCGWTHMANSAALFTALRPRYDTVRPGISAYGILPHDLRGSDQLRPVLALRSQVVFLKDIPAGYPVGYGSTWRSTRPTRIATLPVGYNDGVAWRLGNRGEVLVRGARAKIVGRVSMDYTTVDVGHIRGVEVGDIVTLIGSDGAQTITAEEVAARADTIAYEITCSLGKRVTRVLRGGTDVVVPAQPPPAAAHLPRAAGPSEAHVSTARDDEPRLRTGS